MDRRAIRKGYREIRSRRIGLVSKVLNPDSFSRGFYAVEGSRSKRGSPDLRGEKRFWTGSLLVEQSHREHDGIRFSIFVANINHDEHGLTTIRPNMSRVRRLLSRIESFRI